MEVTVKAKSYKMDSYFCKINFTIQTNELFKKENKEELMRRLEKVIALEIENYEENKKI